MAKTQLSRLVVKLEAEVGRYQRDLEKAQKSNKRFAKNSKRSFDTVKNAIAGIGLGLFTKKVISATIEQESSVKQLEATWKSTGGVVGLTIDEMIQDAERLQGVSVFGDEEIIKAQSQLTTFTNITSDNFKRTTRAALDLSTKMDTDLKSSVVQLGKALNDPVTNMSALSRSGIQFTDAQKDVIKHLAETGRLAEAQTIILDELETQFGGSAEAARDTLGGALKGLNNGFGDLLEADSLTGAKDGIEELTEILQSPETKQAAATFANAIVSSMQFVLNAFTKVINGVKKISESLAAAIHGPAIGDLPRLEASLADVDATLASMGDTLRAQAESNGRSAKAARMKLARLEQEKAALEEKIRLTKELNRVESETVTAEKLALAGAGGGGKIDVNKLFEELQKKKADETAKKDNDKKLIRERNLQDHMNNLRKSARQEDLRDQALYHFRIEQFQQSSATNRIRTALSEGKNLFALFSGSSKKLAKVAKKGALFQAAISTYQGIAKGVSLGWPAGIPAVLWASANGFAQVRKIKSQQFGGGASPSFANLSPPSLNTANVPSGTPASEFINQGEGQNQQATNPGTTNIILSGPMLGVESITETVIAAVAEASDSQRIRVTDESGRLQLEVN